MSDHDIDELTESNRGRYRVHTHTSYYDFDLDLGTVTRHPGPTAPPTINDGTRNLRTITECKVGQYGRWTMRSDGGYQDPIDYYWQQTSVIHRIERLQDEENVDAE